MKVLILTISYSPNVGGVETHLSDWVRFLGSRDEMEVDVLTYQPITTHARGPSFEKQGKIRIFRISWFGRTLFHRLESRPVFQFLYLAPRLLLAAFSHIIRHGRYDVIHAQGLVAIWVGGQLKRIWQIPVLGSTHAIYSFPAKSETAQKMKRVLSLADHVLALSDASLEQLHAYGLPRENISRFTYWVDQRVFTSQPSREARLKHDLPMDRMICLFVGRLLKIKGLELLFDLARRLPDILFLTVGEGPMEHICRNQAGKLSNFRFLGSVPNQELASLYNAADLLLVPSLYEEGFGRVACEALSCGLPVIASNRGGLKEVVKTGVGFLVEPSLEAFASAISVWRKEGGTNPEIRQACRTHAAAHFGEGNAQGLLDPLRCLATRDPLENPCLP